MLLPLLLARLLLLLLLPICLIFLLNFHFLLILHLLLHFHRFLPLLLLLASSIVLWLLLQLGLCLRLLFCLSFSSFMIIVWTSVSVCKLYLSKSDKSKVAPTKYRTGPRTNPNNHFATACPQRSQMLPNLFLTSFYTLESFNYPGYIVHTPTNSVQHWWPPGFSTSDLFSLLELFTRLDHRLCTGCLKNDI